MKINIDSLQQIQQQEQTWNKSKTNTDGFDRLLNQELEKTASSEARQLSAPPPGAKTFGTAALQQAAPSTEQEVMSNIEGILSKWEDYAEQLGAPEAQESLKQAYGLLEGISQDVKGVKSRLEQLEASAGADEEGEQYPGLKSLVDEIEVMALTEQYKFNRGDYS